MRSPREPLFVAECIRIRPDGTESVREIRLLQNNGVEIPAKQAVTTRSKAAKDSQRDSGISTGSGSGFEPLAPEPPLIRQVLQPQQVAEQAPQPPPQRPQPEPERRRMSYGDTWNFAAAAAVSGLWVSLDNFVDCLFEVEKKSFTVAAQRTAAVSLLDGLVTQRLNVRQNQRFPEGIYVNLANKNVNKYLMQLRAALAFKEFDRQAENAAARQTAGQAGPSRGEIREPSTCRVSSDINDSHMAFVNSLTTLIAETTGGALAVDRRKFEQVYSLTWA